MRIPFTAQVVEAAYREAIFPMAYGRARHIGWFRPDPRAIIPLDKFHLSRSLARTLRRGTFDVRVDSSFEQVMLGCADRPEGSWITADFVRVYGDLHRDAKAHSVEAWHDDRLVGGVYGVSLGGAFMAESKFHRETDASKVALAALVARLRERGFVLLDVQYLTPHLERLGAVEIPGADYYALLQQALRLPCSFV